MTTREDGVERRNIMELKVWVEGIQRIVCGVTDKTTCQVSDVFSWKVSALCCNNCNL